LIQKKTTELLTRGIEKIINKKDLDSLLKNGKPLRLKMGFDPSKPDMHLGHVVGLRKLREFQELGHQVILIVGDWTAQIGDPSGQSSMRSMLTRQEVLKNANSYMSQFFSIVDERKTEVSWQSKWFEKFGLEQVFDLTSRFTVAQFLARSDFSLRFNNNKPIAITEFLYPLMQAYDSVAIKSDVEFGGTDQEFNLLVGRDLQTMFDQKPQQCILMPILVGLDGVQKMSKSLGNTVGLDEDPLSMYSKLEKVPDSIVSSYLMLLTDLDINNELNDNPRERQKEMALAVTASFHGLSAANAAQDAACRLVSGFGDDMENVPEVSMSNVDFPAKAFYFLSAIGLCASSSEARRQIQGGAVRLDGQKIVDPNLEFVNSNSLLGKVLQIGKKTFRRLQA